MIDFHDQTPATPTPDPNQRTLAVALSGEGGSQPAKVVAAGRGAMAEQILAIAFEKGVRVREDAGLAEILAALELDTPIPGEAIMAVAEILAKVYEANLRLQQTESVPPRSEAPHG